MEPRGLLCPWLEALLYPGCHKVPPQVITPGQPPTLWQAEPSSIIWDAAQRRGAATLGTWGTTWPWI